MALLDFLTTDRATFVAKAENRLASYARALAQAEAEGTPTDCWLNKALELAVGLDVVADALPAADKRTAEIIAFLVEAHALDNAPLLPFSAAPLSVSYPPAVGPPGPAGPAGAVGATGPAGADGQGGAVLTTDQLNALNGATSPDAGNPFATAKDLETKVDNVDGKGLSTNDFTNAINARLANTSGTNTGDQNISGIAANATAISNEATARTTADAGLQTQATANAGNITTLQGQAATNATNIATNAAAIALKANIASPAFTGAVVVPDATAANQAMAFGQRAFPGTTATTFAAGNDGRLSDSRNTTWASVRGLVSGLIAAVAGAFSAGDTLEVWLGKLLTLVNTNTATTSSNATNVATNATNIANEVTVRANADTNLQTQVTANTSATTANATKIGTAGLTTTATDLSAALNEIRNTLPGTAERTTTPQTLALTDAGNLVPVNSASMVTVTIPPNSSVAFPLGTVINLSQVGAGQILIAAGAGVTLRQADGQLKSAKQWAELSLRKRGTDEWVLTGYTAT